MNIESEIERIKSINATNMNESTAKLSIIFPMLRALGWDTTDPDEVQLEYCVAQHLKGFADIALFSGGKPCVLIETKAPTKQLVVSNHQAQLQDYCKMLKVSLGVLTNGIEWHFFYFDEGLNKEGESPLAEAINLDEEDAHACQTRLWQFLSRDKVSDSGAQTLAKGVWVQRLMATKWKELMTSGDPALVRALRSSIRKSTSINLPLEDIVKFLKERAELRSSPAVSPDSDRTPPPDTGAPSDPDKPKREKFIKPTHIQIRGERHKAKSWKKCLNIFFSEVYKNDPTKFNSTFVSMPYKGNRRSIGIYQDSEEEEMQRLPAGNPPTQIANSNLCLYIHSSAKTIQESIREVRKLLGWPEDSVQIFSEDQRLWPDG